MMDPFCPPVRFGDAFGRGSVTATTAWGVPLFRVPSGEQVDRHSSTAAGRTQADRDYDGDTRLSLWLIATAVRR
jgi:hypothetical protein